MLIPVGMIAQITVTNSIFPNPGDTLKTVTTPDLGGFDRTMVGEGLTWDLSNAGTGATSELIYQDAMEGDSASVFPDADLLDASSGQEIYYRTFNNKIVEIGRSGLDPVLGAINLTVNTEGEAILRRAPISYNDAFDEESSFLIESSASIVPDSLLGGLAGSVDSLRLGVTTAHDDFVDAWGTMTIPTGTYDVLRVNRSTINDVTLEAKVVVLGWVTVDPSNPLFGGLGELLDLLGENRTTSYQFYAEGSKELIADLTTDTDDNLVSLTYKADEVTSTKEISASTQDIKVYPNPTFGDITFDVQKLPADDYSVVLFNVIGKELWSSKIDRSTGRLDTYIGHLQKGTYLYSILDGTGRKVTTRRVVVMTP